MTKSSEYKSQIDPIITKLRDERLALGIKQKDVASLLELNTDSSLSAYENGQVVPRISFVRSWATVLDYELVLNKLEKPVRGRRKTAAPDTAPPEDTNAVHLTQYQIALAMGMLISAAHSTSSERLSHDLAEIADVLAKAL